MKRVNGVGILLSAIWLIALVFGCGGGGGNSPKLSKLPPIDNNLPKASWNEFIEITRSIMKAHPGIQEKELSRLIHERLKNQTNRKVNIPWTDNDPTDQEFALAIAFPKKAILTFLATIIARKESGTLFPQEGVWPYWRTKEDAFRHSFWNVLICILVNEQWAETWTTAHESEEDPNNRDTKMDIHNNAVGRYVYHQHRWNVNVASDCSRVLVNYLYTKMSFIDACYTLNTLVYIRNNNEDKEGRPWDNNNQDNEVTNDWPNINIDITLADIVRDDFDIDEYILEWPGGSSEDTSTSDPSDITPPTLSWAKIETLGNGKFDLVAQFADNSSGVDKNRFWLQDSAYNWHQIGNWNFDNPSTLPVDMNGQTLVGNWKFFVEAYDESGNHLDRTDTGRAIGWGAPWIEDQSMEGPSNTGQSTYRAKFDSFSGHAGIAWSELFYWISERYYRIGGRINGWQAEWVINPLDYPNLEKGKAYPLTLIVMGTNGVKADMIPAGFYLTVPTVVIPPERGKESLTKYEPAGVPWWWENKYLAVTGWHGPYGPNNFDVNLTIYVEGTQHSRSTEHCPVSWGKDGGVGYAVMGAWGYGYWMRLIGNINSLPTGLHCIGAEMRLDGYITGPIRAKDSWIWVDKDHPLFDKIIEGPTSGSTIKKSQNTELCIRTTMQDPGGSGTTEYWLALVGQGQERGFKERIYGYTGINHCNLAGLPNGQYELYTTYSKDKVGNVQTRSLPTGVIFEITD